MPVERTLSIIKPDATRRNLTGAMNDRLEKAGLRIVAQKRLQLSRAQAEAFYGVHRERPFFASLVEFMTSGPVVVQALQGEDAAEEQKEVARLERQFEGHMDAGRFEEAVQVGKRIIHSRAEPQGASHWEAIA